VAGGGTAPPTEIPTASGMGLLLLAAALAGVATIFLARFRP
jgi:hypothetical protein